MPPQPRSGAVWQKDMERFKECATKGASSSIHLTGYVIAN